MAKKGGKSKGYISSGINSNVSSSIRNKQRREYLASGARCLNQLLAHKAGKQVVVTIENPNREERNKRFIRVPASSLWKDPRSTVPFMMN